MLNQPLEIHDIYIQGAYPCKAQDAFSGGGIKTNAKAGDSAQEVPAFNSMHDNLIGWNWLASCASKAIAGMSTPRVACRLLDQFCRSGSTDHPRQGEQGVRCLS